MQNYQRSERAGPERLAPSLAERARRRPENALGRQTVAQSVRCCRTSRARDSTGSRAWRLMTSLN